MNANLTGLDTGEGRVTSARVEDFEGNAAIVAAKVFVLACGGIENSRLLLHFNASNQGRLIPQAETLGRYWMEHLYSYPGEAFMKQPIDDRRTFDLSAEKQRELGVLNCRIRVRENYNTRTGLSALARGLACHVPRIDDWVRDLRGEDLSAQTVFRSHGSRNLAATTGSSSARRPVMLSAFLALSCIGNGAHWIAKP